MKRIAIGMIALGIMTGPVYAQQQQKQDDAFSLEREAKKRDTEQIDRQYKAMMRRTDPEKVTRVDPWHNMRAPSNSTADLNNKR
jgi:hypothetical protein